MYAALRLTVEVEANRGVALAELVFGGDPVLSGVLDGHLQNLQHRKIGVPVLLHNHLRKWHQQMVKTTCTSIPEAAGSAEGRDEVRALCMVLELGKTIAVVCGFKEPELLGRRGPCKWRG